VADPRIKELAYDALAATLGAPVDLFATALRPLGYRDQPVLGSEFIRQRLPQQQRPEIPSPMPEFQRAARASEIPQVDEFGRVIREAPVPERQFSPMERFVGAAETAETILRGVAGFPVALVGGVAQGIREGDVGARGLEDRMSSILQNLGYMPKTEAGQEMLGETGKFFERLETEYKVPAIGAAPSAVPLLGVRGVPAQVTTAVAEELATPPRGAIGPIQAAREMAPVAQGVEKVRESIVSKNPDIKLDVSESQKSNILTIGRIEVPKEKRGQGIGSSVMNDIIDYADANGKTIALSPSKDFGATSIARLKEFYKDLGFVENKGRNKDFTISESMYRPPAVSANQIETPNFKNWFGDWQASPEMASKVVDAEGKPLAVYHGTARPDRIGEQFRKSRATSGPMSFFTDDPNIASGYAKGKQDTSLAYENTNYESWFKKKEGRSTLNLDQVGARMSQQERQQVLDKLRRIGQDDQGNIVLGEGLVSDSTFDFMLKDPREAGGNPLKLAKQLWLESGTLYGREEDFSKILNLAGVKGFEQDFPTASYPAVYKTFLNIRNPLDTANIDEYTMAQLEYVANRTRKAPQRGGADPWDKNVRDPKEWFRQLKEDYDAGQNSMVWTSIPDWVTKALKNIGYDGIKDSGGKFGGQGHTVWIPFEENQVKSATGNIGTFDPSKKSILRGAAAAPIGAAAVQEEEQVE
jgi:GNAT superfamily N-acetyltransferase